MALTGHRVIIAEDENGVFLAAGEDADKGTERSRQRDFTLKSFVPGVEFRKRGFSVFHPSTFICSERFWEVLTVR